MSLGWLPVSQWSTQRQHDDNSFGKSLSGADITRGYDIVSKSIFQVHRGKRKTQ
jgi:hypothetical protein